MLFIITVTKYLPNRCPMPTLTTPTITYLSANLSPKRQHSELLGQEITELYGQSA